MRSPLFAALAVALAALPNPAPAAAEAPAGHSVPARLPGRAPATRVRFEPNLGQWDPAIRFLGRGPSCRVLLADGEAVFRLGGALPAKGTLRGPRSGGLVPAGPGGILRMRFEGARPSPALVPSGRLPSVSHYFLGNDRSRWRSPVPHYDRAAYRDLWPGIDLVFRGDPARLEYDLVVAPGADLSAARLRFSGQKGLAVDASGDLVLRMEAGEVRHGAPRLFQEGPEGRRAVPGAFRVLDTSTVGFEAGPHDRGLPLVVDPVVDYASYLGGSVQDWSEDVAVDGNGNIVVVGWTDSTDFPLASPLQGTHGGGTNDAFVSRYAPDGQSLIHSTYFGGNGFDDCMGVAVDGSGGAIVCGFTSSTDFPTASPFQGTFGGGYDDIYLARFTPAGDALSFSTYYGVGAQDEAYDVAVDATGIYLAAATNDPSFPVQAAVRSTYGGAPADALIVKFAPSAASVLYATYYGGTGQDIALGVAVDSAGAVRVAGETSSTDFPLSTPFQSVFGGSGTNPFPGDAFCLKLAPGGGSVSWASYLGGASDDFCEQVAVNAQGETFLAGHTASTGFPTVLPLRGTYGGGTYDAWCAKVNAAGTALLFSTFWGGSGAEYARGIGLDPSGNVLFCGITASPDLPLQNAFQGTYQGGSPVNNDGFFARLSPAGDRVLASSFFGSGGADDPQGMAVDGTGAAVIAGLTDSTAFPVVNPLQSSTGGGSFDAYLLRVKPTPPVPPSVLIASLFGGSAIQLTWVDASTNETSFQVERRTGAGPFASIATVVAGVAAYQDFGVLPSTTYTYRVRAANDDGPSAWTNEASATTGASIPAPTSPNNLVVTVVSTTQANLSWTDRSGNETLFEVQRRTVPGTFAVAASLPANTVSWSNTGLAPDTSLLYRVRAVGVSSPSAWTSEAAALTPPTLALAGLKASIADSPTAAKDVVKAKGTYSFLAASPDAAFDPVADGLTLLAGTEADPLVLTVPPGDPGWVVKKNKATWKTLREDPTKAKVVIDTVKRTFTVSLTRVTFTTPVANPVRFSLRAGNDAGSVRTTWANPKPGKFSLKQ